MDKIELTMSADNLIQHIAVAQQLVPQHKKITNVDKSNNHNCRKKNRLEDVTESSISQDRLKESIERVLDIDTTE